MSWKKHFTQSPLAGNMSAVGSSSSGVPGPARLNYSSFLPDVYSGAPNRIERYLQFDSMDIDAEICSALDILAQFCTQLNKQNNTPFVVQYNDRATNSETKILKEYLQQWSRLQEFDIRLFRMVRNLFKYGDAFFIRDPETFKWMWIDSGKVTRVIVNESLGKKPQQYIIRDLSINFHNLVATQINPNTQNMQPGGAAYVSGGAGARGMTGAYPQISGSRFSLSHNEHAIGAEHVVHISLSEGLDNFYPFGQSRLESVFKVYKQKELLEDAILIYRIQRAPERRVFYIDVGEMPSHLAMSYVERVKNEIHQRRIPSASGGTSGGSVIDSSYNPMSTLEDYYFPQSSSGRGSRVDVLPGGCFAMDTKISLLDGRELSIKEIADEMASGKELWTYSCEPKTGKVVPGLISWAGVTQKSAKVMKLTLDNGAEIICTPDHKFPIYGQDFKEARDFSVGESLIPLYKKTETVDPRSNSTYEKVYDNESKTWVFTHRMVADYLRDSKVHYHVHDKTVSNGEYSVRHHIDFNRYNNDPNNLCFMCWFDHAKLHQDLAWMATSRMALMKERYPEEYTKYQQRVSKNSKDRWESYTEDEYVEICNRIRIGIQKYIDGLTEDEAGIRAKISGTNARRAAAAFHRRFATGVEFHDRVVANRMEYWTKENRRKQSIKITEDNYKRWARNGDALRENHRKIQKLEFCHEMMVFVIDTIRDKSSHQVGLADVVAELNSNARMLELLDHLNHDKRVPNWKVSDGFTESNVKMMVMEFGYSGWSDLRRKHSIHNHRIVNIEYLPYEMEVGTLTIDNDEIYHDYHTFALACGVFTKNSNLDQIDDLRFFTNKMMRALRIPSSYLPTGPEESQTNYTDGRVGTAYIQELRFNQECERLQRLMVPIFDREFKLFLKQKGINIDFSLFQLVFQTPQNFAAYRQAELDNQRISTFNQMAALPFISKRYALKRFLGLTDDEIAENERLWKEESGAATTGNTDAASEMRSIGVTPAGMEADIGNFSEPEQVPPEEGIDQGMPPSTGAQ